MRNKDGVSSIIGHLKEHLCFHKNVQEAGAYYSGKSYYGNTHKGKLTYVQRWLASKGYTGFEFVGYVMFFRIMRPEEKSGEHILKKIDLFCSEAMINEFLKFKENRARAVEVDLSLALQKYKRGRDIGIRTPEEVLEGMSWSDAYKLEISQICLADFSEEYAEGLWVKYGPSVGETFRFSPEMLVHHSRTRKKLNLNGGDNEYAKRLFRAT